MSLSNELKEIEKTFLILGRLNSYQKRMLKQVFIDIDNNFKESIQELKEKQNGKFGILMEAISQFALYEATRVWDSKKVFGNNKPTFKFIGDLILEISKLPDEVFGEDLI